MLDQTLSDELFNKISAYIGKNVGIKLPKEKHLMVQSRLASRLKALSFKSYEDYLNFVFSDSPEAQEEMISMIDVITTNLTHFFREEPHFDYLTQSVFPELAEKGIKVPEIWSAGCSSGQEPYTLSIVTLEYMRKNPNKFQDFKILATDISTKMLAKAASAVYPIESIEKIPKDILKRHFLRGKDGIRVRIKPETRQKVSFQRLNFMDPDFSVSPKKDVIFCRNVLIYFEKSTQFKVISQLLNNLNPGGYLFLGHSETIFGMDLPIKTVAPTVFKKVQE